MPYGFFAGRTIAMRQDLVRFSTSQRQILWGASSSHIAPERFDLIRRRCCANFLGHHVSTVVMRSIDMSALFHRQELHL